MNPARITSGIVTLFIWCFLVSGNTVAQDTACTVAHETETNTSNLLSYNIALLTLGVNHYWLDTGRMPGSMEDLFQADLIPAGLKNPISGDSLVMDPINPGPGDITYTLVSDGYATLNLIREDFVTVDLPVDSSFYTPSMKNRPDRIMELYIGWCTISLEYYYKNYRTVPGTLDDLLYSDYWPFEGAVNPVTGETLQFFDNNPGNLFFLFEESKVFVWAFDSENRVCGTILDPSQQPWLPSLY